MFRYDFVSNSSSTSFIIDKKTFDDWRKNDGEEFKLDLNTFTLDKYLAHCGYRGALLSLKYSDNPEVSMHSYVIVDDDEFVKRYCKGDDTYMVIPLSLVKDTMDLILDVETYYNPNSKIEQKNKPELRERIFDKYLKICDKLHNLLCSKLDTTMEIVEFSAERESGFRTLEWHNQLLEENEYATEIWRSIHRFKTPQFYMVEPC